jgi:hypothetical protein
MECSLNRIDLEAANLQLKMEKAPWSQWLCFERAMLLAS